MESGRGSKGLGHGLPIDGTGQAKLGGVTRIVGMSAMASGLSAAARDGANRAWAQIAKVADLAQDLRALDFQSRQRIWHKGFLYLSIL
jgi:hypothetical protein